MSSIEPWRDTSKYVLNFKGPATALNRIPLVPNGRIMAPQGPRYTSFARLQKAKNLDEVF